METQEQKNNKSSSTTPETKPEPFQTVAQVRTTKWLAVFGFIAMVVALAWFLFTAIAFAPNLFSLVGSAISSDTTAKTAPEIILTPRETTATPDEPLALSWEASTTIDGTFAVWFACEPGVDIALATPTDGRQDIRCATYYNVGELTALNVFFSTANVESTTVAYEITFVPTDESIKQSGNVGTLTVTSSTLAMNEDSNEEEDEVTEIESEPIPQPDQEEAPVEEESTTQPAPHTPQYREQIVYRVPQSDPQGTTDLHASFSRVGVLDNGSFTTTATFNRGERGAIRFTVTNQGNRTSENWTYTAELPNGQVYQSPTQAPLRPNETATISLGLRAPSEIGTYPFSVKIDTSRDISTANHSFSWSVVVD